MTRQSFKKIILDTVTEGYRIPTAPNDLALNTIINNSLRWFRQNDDESVEFEYIVISAKNFTTPLFKQKRQVQMPDCVEAIEGLQDSGALFSFSGLIGQRYGDTGFNRAMMIGSNSDNMLYGVIASYYDDFVKNNFTLRTIAFDYNPHSKMLVIKGRDPNYDLIAMASVHCADENIFNNDRFHRYVIGQVKMSFGRVFGFSKFKTIGGLDVDVTSLKSEGKTDVDDVKKEIIDARAGDFLSFM